MITTRQQHAGPPADWRSRAGHPPVHAAILLSVSLATLRRRMEDESIRAVRLGRRIIIPTTEIERILAEGTR